MSSCAALRAVVRWFVAGTGSRLIPDTTALREHLVACALCRGTVATLMAEQLQLLADPATLPAIECAEARLVLPTFIDAEHRDPAAALRRFPHVWWHVMTCAECSDIYAMTQELIAAAHEPVGALSAQPAATTVLLHWSRALLQQIMVVLLPQFAPARGSGQRQTLFDDLLAQGHHVKLSIVPTVADRWNVEVLVTPVPQQQVVLAFGTHEFQCSFNEHGLALFESLPSELFTATDGPPLELRLE